MSEILITIYVLSLNEEYDMFLPIGMKVIEAIDLIQNTIVEMSLGNYEKVESPLLYNEEGLLINTNNIVKYSGIKNGSKILLK